jgi:DNA-binding beta-propeller fold protein YncE
MTVVTQGGASAAPVTRRWLRLVLLLGALGSAAAGQYYLSISFDATRAAMAWGAAMVLAVALYAAGRDAAELPAAAPADVSRRGEWILATLVLGIGTFFTVFRLSEFPPGLNHDAAWEGLYAIRILDGIPYTPYVSAAWGRETFTFYLRAASIWFLGPTSLAVIAPSVAAGVLLLPFFYWWARNMFGSRFALLATLFIGVSGWHLVFSRSGWRSDFQPLFMVITCCFFIRGMLTARWWDFAISGVALAAALNTYNGARPFPLMFPLWIALVIAQSWSLRGFIRRYGAGLLAMAVAGGVTVAPLAWYAFNNWNKFQARAVALQDLTSPWAAVAQTLLLFNYRGNGDDFFIGTPGLEYPTAIFLVFGVIWGLLRIRDERAQFLLLGLVVNALGGLLSKPNMNRNIGMMPFVYFFVALGVTFFAQQMVRLVPRVGRALAALFIVAVGAAAAQATYMQYLSPARRDIWGFYPETAVLGRFMKTLVPQYQIFVGDTPYFPRDALTYLTYQGSGDPFERKYTWVDDVGILLRIPLTAPPGKGLALLLENAGRGPKVLAELRRRYPNHTAVELRYPPETGRVFARGILVPPDAAATGGAVPVQDVPGVATEVVEPAVPGGKLHQPRGVALTPSGNVWVADFANDRVQEFSPALSFVRALGAAGDLPGEFKQPSAIAVGPSGDIYVADTWNHRVQVFASDGAFVREIKAGFYGPRGVAVDTKGDVYVTDTGNNRIVRFSPEGEKQLEWGTKGTEQGQFLEPVGVAVDRAGKVYVSDNGNGRLQIFNPDGTFLRSFEVPGWRSEVYSEPHIAIDVGGIVWVTVPGEKAVRAYDANGKLLKTVTGSSLPAPGFEKPMGIAFDAKNRELVVSDLENRLVRIPAAVR